MFWEILEQHQILAEEAHRLDGAYAHGGIEVGVEFIQQGNGVPIVSQQFAARRAGSDACDEVVLAGVHDDMDAAACPGNIEQGGTAPL